MKDRAERFMIRFVGVRGPATAGGLITILSKSDHILPGRRPITNYH